jgi:hypothetical protein
MSETVLNTIADKADMIFAGYAYTIADEKIKVINLENPDSAAVLDREGNMLETSMSDVELALVESYYIKNIELLEETDA